MENKKSHKAFNPVLKKTTHHVPNWDWSTHAWDTDGSRKVWCRSAFCSQSLIIGNVRIVCGNALTSQGVQS